MIWHIHYFFNASHLYTLCSTTISIVKHLLPRPSLDRRLWILLPIVSLKNLCVNLLERESLSTLPLHKAKLVLPWDYITSLTNLKSTCKVYTSMSITLVSFIFQHVITFPTNLKSRLKVYTPFIHAEYPEGVCLWV